jgi:hypothetical protein
VITRSFWLSRNVLIVNGIDVPSYRFIIAVIVL